MTVDYIIVSLSALLVAGLTLFSGFGLGTLLMPVFAVFSFALPAAVAAVFGALTLSSLNKIPAIARYSLENHIFTITPVKLIIGVLMIIFALFELIPRFEKLQFQRKYLPAGGLLSGFFGGLSGHQGALRSAFLVKAGLTKEAFIGTGVISAVVVDVSRLIVYGLTFFTEDFMKLQETNQTGIVLAAVLAAFAGSFAGSRLIKKIKMRSIQIMVGIMLLLLAIALAAGII